MENCVDDCADDWKWRLTHVFATLEALRGSERLTEVDGKGDGGGEDERSDEFDSDYELHTKAERAAQIADQNQFHQVVNCTVDPSSSL